MNTTDLAAAARRKARRLLVLGLVILAAELGLAFTVSTLLFTIIGLHWWLWVEAAERYGWARGYEAHRKETPAPDLHLLDKIEAGIRSRVVAGMRSPFTPGLPVTARTLADWVVGLVRDAAQPQESQAR